MMIARTLIVIALTSFYSSFFYTVVSAIPLELLEELSTQIPDQKRCNAIMSSKHAQFFEQNIENDENFGIDDNPTRLRLSSDVLRRNSRLQRIIRTLRSGIYAPKMCNPETFYPVIADESESPMSCYQICASCVPGSAAVCHQKHHRFPGIGQTCFCTFSHESPLHKAVLVIKNPHYNSRPSY